MGSYSYGRVKPKRTPILRAPAGYVKLGPADQVGGYPTYFASGQIAVLIATPPTDYTRTADEKDFRYFDNLDDARTWLKETQSHEAIKALDVHSYHVHSMEHAVLEVAWSEVKGVWVETKPYAGREHSKGSLSVYTEERYEMLKALDEQHTLLHKQQTQIEVEWKKQVEAMRDLPVPEKKPVQ